MTCCVCFREGREADPLGLCARDRRELEAVKTKNPKKPSLPRGQMNLYPEN